MADKMKNALSKIYDQVAISSIIKNTKDLNKSVIGWRMIDGQKRICNLSLRVNRKSKGEFVVTPRDDKDLGCFRELLSGNESFNVFLPDDNVLFQTSISFKDNFRKEITLNYPSMIAQIDRRKTPRYKLGPLDQVTIKAKKILRLLNVKEQILTKNAYDISSGGISFLVSRTEKSFFHENDLLDGMQVKIDDYVFSTISRVVKVLEIKPDNFNNLSYPEYRITINFEFISNVAKNKINEYILEKMDLSKAVS